MYSSGVTRTRLVQLGQKLAEDSENPKCISAEPGANV